MLVVRLKNIEEIIDSTLSFCFGFLTFPRRLTDKSKTGNPLMDDYFIGLRVSLKKWLKWSTIVFFVSSQASC